MSCILLPLSRLCFDGIERLGKEYPEELKQNPIGRELLMTWMGKAQQIRRQNMKVNAVAGKLVRCVKGRVLDVAVAVDIRKGSPTYGKHVAVELTEDNHRQIFIPKGFAHGFAVLSETAVFQYKCDNFYHPEADGGISILDESLGIDWRIPTEHANLSEKDTKHVMLKDFDSPF